VLEVLNRVLLRRSILFPPFAPFHDSFVLVMAIAAHIREDFLFLFLVLPLVAASEECE